MLTRGADGEWREHELEEPCCDWNEGMPRLRMRRRQVRRGDTWVPIFQAVQDVASGFLYTARPVFRAPTPVPVPPFRMPFGAVPLNLSSATKVWVTVKLFVSDGDGRALAQMSTGAGLVVTTPSQGLFNATMSAALTLGFPDMETELAYDAQVLIGGVVTTIEIGRLTVRPDVTSSLA